MGSKLDAMKAAAANKPPAKPKLHKVKVAVQPDGGMVALENSVEERAAVLTDPIVASMKKEIQEISLPGELLPPTETKKKIPWRPIQYQRLPHGAIYHYEYTATASEDGFWDAWLTIPVEGGEPLVFHLQRGGVKMLHIHLSRMYRAHVKNSVAPEQPVA